MANGSDTPEPQDNFATPPASPVEDLSAFDDDMPASALNVGSDEEALKKIGRHTTPFGRVVTVAIILAVIAIGGLYFYNDSKFSAQEDALAAINDMDAAEAPAALRALLPEVSNPDLRQRIIMNLGYYRDAAAVPLLVAALDEAGKVRRAAAWALARVGLPGAESAKAKLLAVLPDTDESDHVQVVWTLALLQEGQASDAIVAAFAAGRLQSLDGFDPKVITDVLGVARLSDDGLLQHESAAVRELTAHALAEVASAEVVDPLSRLLQAELARPEDSRSAEVIRATAAGLGRTGDARAATPLFNLLASDPDSTHTVIDSLSRSTGARGLIVLLQQNPNDSVKVELVRLVAESHDPQAADTLAGLVNDPSEEVRTTATMALAEFGDPRATEPLLALARGEDEEIANNALNAIRLLGTSDLGPALVTLLGEMEHRRAAILRAIGGTGDASMARHLEAALATDDQRAAALALADLGDDSGFRKLKALLVRPRDLDLSTPTVANEEIFLNRGSAVQAMGRFGRPEVVPELMTIVEDPMDDNRLRDGAAESLGMIATADDIRTILGKVQSADLDEDSRRYYVRALWRNPDPSLAGPLMDLMESDAPRELRRAAALAVGYMAMPDNDARLMSMLDNENTDREAAVAIVIGGSPEAARKLVQALKASRDLREVMQQVLAGEENDWFNVVTEPMFASGQIWRRIHAAEILNVGDGDDRYSYAWTKLLAALSSGWDGNGGLTTGQIRQKLWEALVGDDAERSRLAARVLADMPERGLLLRARDDGGSAGDAARAELMRINRPVRASE